jgi:1,4-dihydroxy-2-naphthoyl-CoA hydrolase
MAEDSVDLVSLMPFAADLGMRIESASGDEVVGRLDWAPRLCTTAGSMHGGVLMSFADTLGAGVTFLGLPDGATTATITSTTQMFRPVTGGTVRGVAEIVHRGRTVVAAVTRLYDDNDKLVAQTTQIQAVRTPPA